MAQSEKAMATHSSTLAWRIPWTEETGGLHSMGVAKSRTGLSMHECNQRPEFLCLRMEEWKLELLLKTYSQNIFVP